MTFFLLNLLEKYFNFFFAKAHNKLAFIKVLFFKNQNIYWECSVIKRIHLHGRNAFDRISSNHLTNRSRWDHFKDKSVFRVKW